MGRPLRYIAANTTYHVYSRCINNENRFQDDQFKEIFLQALKETLVLFSFELNAYEIMPNHIHLVITTKNEEDTISKILQRLKSVTAKRYNKLVGRCGPFWNERFKDEIVQYFPSLCVYLAYNPVRHSISKRPTYSKYSSYGTYTQKHNNCTLKITHHKQFIKSGKTFQERRKILKLFEKVYNKKQK